LSLSGDFAPATPSLHPPKESVSTNLTIMSKNFIYIPLPYGTNIGEEQMVVSKNINFGLKFYNAIGNPSAGL
ncbi:MAG: hypothetical protein K9H49_06470, partial [Bacteroidales bacterium]|nr:hypothetical protein [Bacteroidales bacterium]MCF8389318.1 hypothetical protein [Bacteroidales bacterium]